MNLSCEAVAVEAVAAEAALALPPFRAAKTALAFVELDVAVTMIIPFSLDSVHY
jgi:hypothetical protein